MRASGEPSRELLTYVANPLFGASRALGVRWTWMQMAHELFREPFKEALRSTLLEARVAAVGAPARAAALCAA
jgi:hypothetical protein